MAVVEHTEYELETLAVCDLCASAEHREIKVVEDLSLGTPGRHRLVRCQGCGLHFINPRPAPEAIAQFYPDSYEFFSDAKPAPLKKWQRLAGAKDAPRVGWLRRFLLGRQQTLAFHFVPPFHGDGKLLDLGCGSGAFLDTMKQLGWETHGVEVSPKAAQVAVSKGHQVVVGLADEPLGYADDSFDLVYMSHTLEHTFSPTKALANIRRVLKPGGRLVLAVPNYGGIQAAMFGQFWSALDAPRHLFHFDSSTLRRYLEAAGFDIVDLVTRTGATSWARSTRLILNRVLGTKWRSEPAWLIGLFEAPTFVSGLFRYFGRGRDLRVVCEKPASGGFLAARR
jgi:SAM-dependent methyltransferase